MNEVLEVNNLSVAYPEFTLQPISFKVGRGEIVSIIGESGSGKTTIAKAISCLLDNEIKVAGQVFINHQEILSMEEKKRRLLRMKEFAIVFQNSNSWLNPSMTLENHLKEVLVRYYDKKVFQEKMDLIMNKVGLSKSDLKKYPAELSGGMAQKFMIACAIALNPKLIILDEPTSSLDVESRDFIMSLIKNLNEEQETSFLIITHDLKLASELSSKIIILYNGHVMEMGKTSEIINNPNHPYTRGLIQSSMGLNIVKDLWGIRNCERKADNNGCPFYGRCTQSIEICKIHSPGLNKNKNNRLIACNRNGIVQILEGRNIVKTYAKESVLRGVNIRISSGEVVSIIGRSGVGKSTLAEILAGFQLNTDHGEILFEGKPVNFKAQHKSLGGIQMVFQDSEKAINPYMSVKDAMEEPLRLAKQYDKIDESVKKALSDTGLPIDSQFLNKKIKNLSGGQKQRVNLARALTMEPKILIADEPTSMLDPSSKANLIRMLKGIQNEKGFTMLIITHDLESSLKISDRIFLLREGKLEKINPNDYLQVSINNILEGGN